ncbi:hypothetical protein LNKW23_03080 [Paralimibaculum aggregatum]|uniref:DUF805 domain-containing protein n=1 Tax=Paralimibaculum aggregatum TaxID=3036245 RepID=A0ABQ6LL14_9RHOB|nr:hypothetical protein [Limibaculum sp. NKW23]GMG81096.1 hypothetical protein LNKW23_03080 [Limibaculum sp. NKW23]
MAKIEPETLFEIPSGTIHLHQPTLNVNLDVQGNRLNIAEGTVERLLTEFARSAQGARIAANFLSGGAEAATAPPPAPAPDPAPAAAPPPAAAAPAPLPDLATAIGSGRGWTARKRRATLAWLAISGAVVALSMAQTLLPPVLPILAVWLLAALWLGRIRAGNRGRGRAGRRPYRSRKIGLLYGLPVFGLPVVVGSLLLG